MCLGYSVQHTSINLVGAIPRRTDVGCAFTNKQVLKNWKVHCRKRTWQSSLIRLRSLSNDPFSRKTLNTSSLSSNSPCKHGSDFSEGEKILCSSILVVGILWDFFVVGCVLDGSNSRPLFILPASITKLHARSAEMFLFANCVAWSSLLLFGPEQAELLDSVTKLVSQDEHGIICRSRAPEYHVIWHDSTTVLVIS